MGNIILVILILIEIGFVGVSLYKKSNLRKEKSIVRIALFATFLLLIISPIIDWGFQWVILSLFLGIQTLWGVLILARKNKNTSFKSIRAIFTGLSRALLIIMAVLPVLIFPQYEPIKPTGEYSVGTVSYTLTDEAREEYFTEAKDNRKITIQFWYPSDKSGQETIAKGKFPLVIFSHGAFGYRMSNYSTFQELASNGYIVGSIDHTYHAFMTKQEDGETIIGNMEFMNNAMRAQNSDMSAEEIYELEKDWMKLRTGDMAFVLDYIKQKAASTDAETVYQSIDVEHIGLFGHSLGGATAAQIGRVDANVDAVIVVDGTMLGDIIGFENGKDVITDAPYPKPILNIYNESHYDEALTAKDTYPNMVASANALDAYQMVVGGSGHMNFTDLPLISPFLSKLLETGKKVNVDARYCIETTNEAILQFFDHYLKSNNIELAKERYL